MEEKRSRQMDQEERHGGRGGAHVQEHGVKARCRMEVDTHSP